MTQTVAEAIRSATTRLSQASDTARLDAELLMAHALDVSRSDMLLRHQADVEPDLFASLVERRVRCEPVAYIVGKADFYGLELVVGPDVLIPRPDSEVLIEAARDAFEGRQPPQSVLDLGTGSGALLLAAMSVFPDAFGHAVDASSSVLYALNRNIQRHASGRAVAFVAANWREKHWSTGIDRVDLILCNPPYVEDGAELAPDVRAYEPASALFAGPDGLDDYRILIPQLRDLMNDDAVAVFEIGSTQAPAVTEIAQASGFVVEMRRDLADRPRALIMR